ncbi:Activator of Hsp90 ATPase 1 family protein [Nitrospina gracilis 3/211]|uniref:Activator of Hsp90 ATPase 1 family protein n=1 Tax=Nitrospina gracilis (strain 3/211) TaxID=1266370 RepID=M1Z118_NITG3|nr:MULTISPECIES: SRPBCC domain-containing protein [Nitrospina]MCF8724066.1 uncharacterized protein YndB with AHSA1/START domain [Nitrospina sp. Nb-3]CCQ91199.1 Activator of Hsp90 ATPase 1 family protein [Nitrospina gracilis 3/211]
MNKNNFKTELTLRADASAVFDAVATRDGICGWWTVFTRFDGNEGSVATMRFPKTGFFVRMQVEKLETDRLVHWKCIEAEHPPGVSSDPNDWVGTEVIFEIESLGEGAHLAFTHVGLAGLECNDVCSDVWGFFLHTSLKAYVETGKGEPTVE